MAPGGKGAPPFSQPAAKAPVVVIPGTGPGSASVGSANDDDAEDPADDVDDPNMGRDDGDGY